MILGRIEWANLWAGFGPHWIWHRKDEPHLQEQAAPWGLLKRKQTTCHPAFHDKLSTFWAVKSKIQVPGELTTSGGPGTSFQFALSFVDQLFGESIDREIGQLLLMEAADKNPKTEEFNKIEWSIDHTPCVSASQGTKVIADKLITNTSDTVPDLIILPGGTACSAAEVRVLKKLLKEQDSGGRIYGVIFTPLLHVLSNSCSIQDNRATAHPLILNSLCLSNERIEGARVVIHGRVITGQGLVSSADFGLAVVRKLFGHGRARSVAERLVFEYPRS
ncbi:hypothetical protein SAY86_012900 [Trapa natans]|uniref:DJ-1/PfpI domain-containing protein n=1 Tax=Trapa natans TaxID=22666 RepID=A0AAN7LXH6_TRANT|nr:hypothetical protein SAY86_012900 [Trapa natans]